MPPSLRCPTSTPICAKQLCKAAQSSRSFSTTPRYEQRTTKARRGFFRWLTTQGESLRNPLPGSTNYLGAYNSQGQLKRVVEAELSKSGDKSQKEKISKNATEKAPKEGTEQPSTELPKETNRDRIPFPQCRSFISQPVLTDELKDIIWARIIKDGQSVREVSADLGVEMRRVGAVVRLKEVELEWQRTGKPLAKPYADAVMTMLPKSGYQEDKNGRSNSKEEDDTLESEKRFERHESINDLPVHQATRQQIFHPTSESRHFTRVDAAKVFSEHLKPADKRIPHPELVLQHRELKEGLSVEERSLRAASRAEKAEQTRQKAANRQAALDAQIKRVETPRYEFRFTPINVEDAGKTGRGPDGVGWRYGVPLYDRTKGTVRIPKKVG